VGSKYKCNYRETNQFHCHNIGSIIIHTYIVIGILRKVLVIKMSFWRRYVKKTLADETGMK
jgi:hypothetical protein